MVAPVVPADPGVTVDPDDLAAEVVTEAPVRGGPDVMAAAPRMVRAAERVILVRVRRLPSVPRGQSAKNNFRLRFGGRVKRHGWHVRP